MAAIHKRFEQLYDESFEEACSEYASGSFMKALLQLTAPKSEA